MSKKWNIEKSFFAKEIMGYDPKTKIDQTWPYYDSQENAHLAWLAQVQDPINKEFYKKRESVVEYDDEGKEMPETRKTVEKEPYFERTQIVRLRTREGKEFLYSRGRMYGYTALGSLVTAPFQEPEIWKQTLFKRHMAWVEKENKHREICDGPNDAIIHYTLPFNTENFDKLMKDAAPEIKLVVKEEGKTQAKECPDLEMFKTKSFDYI